MGIGSHLEVRDTINWLGSYPSSPVMEPEKMTSEQNQYLESPPSPTYIKFSEKFDALASDIDDIRELLLEVLQYYSRLLDR